MAYNINGKVFTSHPLMDEIVHNCKLILQSIVVKNDVLANSYEREEFMNEIEVFLMIKDGTIDFSTFVFTADVLAAFGYSYREIKNILRDKENVPIEDRDRLLSFACEYFLENYEEKNKYYRMLSGLPPYGTNEYFVYIDKSYIPQNYTKEIDFSKPIHEMDSSIISLLQSTGKIDILLSQYKGSNYSYLRFLGDNKIDLYLARKAAKYDILYIPVVESLVLDRFQELYNLNKDIYLKRTYSEAYAYDSDYYEQSIILLILCQTFNDMIVDVPEWYIRRDIFDIRSVQYFLESFGVEFYKEIPLKYQIRIVKNLNKLIKFKSSNKNFEDILEIFALDNTAIYKYYLYKKRLRDSVGNYVGGINDNEKYELEFVQAKINESYDNYIKDMIFRTSYDDITYQDKYWDGQDTHEYIKQKHIERDFTIEGTKYMSIEYKVSLSEYLFQMQYLLGLILDSDINMIDLKVSVPSIQTGITFNISDLFLFLVLITYGYDDCNIDIIRPNTITPKKVTYSEEYYDWMKKYLPEVFIQHSDRVYGFNNKADLSQIEDVISRRHSQYQFDNGFTLEELKVDNFITVDKINSFDELVSIFNNNKECYNNLKRRILDDCDDRDEFMVLQYVFNELFTKQFDFEYYKINNGKTDAKSLDQILKDKNYILYNTYNKIMSETNMETRRDNIRSIMNDIVNTLEYYINGEGLDYIFSFTTVASFNSLINYIYLMINFFKSYKVHFIEPFVTYIVDDPMENNVKGAQDAISEKKLRYWKWDREFRRDNMAVTPLFIFDEDRWQERYKEVLDVYGHFEPDMSDDYDYDGLNADTEETGFKDANGGYADPKSCIPFIMLNAGRALNSINLWDINGASAVEPIESVIADGGYAGHIEDYRKDRWNSEFVYSLDGGSASTNQFITKTMRTQVIDRQIESEVRVSKVTGNLLTEKEDGLYLKDNWVEWSTFEEFEKETESTFDEFVTLYNDLQLIVEITDDIDALDKRIESCVNNSLFGMRQVVSYMDNNEFELSLQKYTDDKVEILYNEFLGFSPYTWENF